jgi:O-methyltransferase
MFLKYLPLSWIRYVKFLLQPHKFHLLPRAITSYGTDHLYTTLNADFFEQPKFAEAYRIAEQLGKPLMPPTGMEWRIYTLCWVAEQAKHLPGDFVACGVFSGFCDRAIMHYIDFQNTNKTYYLLDTFEGLDARYSSQEELKRQERYTKFSNMYEQVKHTFKDFNTKIIKGSIPDTLPEADTAAICFLSIDMNTAQPEVEALRYFWPKLVKGGVIVLDDYGFRGCEAQKKAHDAFAASVGTSVFAMPTGQGIMIKL